MPFNGSGVFTRNYSWTTDQASGIPMQGSRFDADANDIVGGLSNCVTRDGQGYFQANVNANGYRLSNLSLGTAALPSVYGQGAASTGLYFPSAGTMGVATGGIQAALFDSSQNTTLAGSLTVNGAAVSGTGITNLFASPPALGGTTPAAAAFTSLSASGTVSGAGFNNLFASPPAIGGAAAAAGKFTTLQSTGIATLSSVLSSTIGAASGNALNLQSNGVTNLTLNASAQLSLAGTSSAWGTSTNALDIGNYAAFAGVGGSTFMGFNAYATSTSAFAYKNSATTALGYWQTTGGHQWLIAPSGSGSITFTQAMTLDNSGNLLVGQTALNTGYGWSFQPSGASYANNNAQASGWGFITFERSGTSIGSITQSGTAAVAYNTSSDPRLKNITGAISAQMATSFYNQLLPKYGTWKADGSPFYGFLTSDYSVADPDGVIGAANAVDANGNPIYQQMEYANSTWVGMTTAVIQSILARLAAANIA